MWASHSSGPHSEPPSSLQIHEGVTLLAPSRGLTDTAVIAVGSRKEVGTLPTEPQQEGCSSAHACQKG